MDSKQRESVTVNPELVKKIFENSWEEPSTKGTKRSMHVATELVNLFVKEAIRRSVRTSGDEDTVLPKHLESVLPQLLLDF